MIDETPFREMIAANPTDSAPKLVWADWKEENGDAVGARYLREECRTKTVSEFSEDQSAAIVAIKDWFRKPDSKHFSLAGYAGTGKSTVLSYLANEWPGAGVAALCGKAANVLRSKGIHRAQTIHSLMYEPFESMGKLHFRKKGTLLIDGGRQMVSRVLIDEASMIDQKLYDDLLSFDVPVLFVGDHGQLEPIGRDVGLMKTPRLTLNEIHRQALDNPIIRLSIAFRERRPVPHWTDKQGRLTVTGRDRFWGLITPHATIICGFNKTRHLVNRRVREMLGFTSPHPVPGEQLICLQNNKKFGIFNGQRAICRKCRVKTSSLELEVETEDGRLTTIPCLKEQFGSDAMKDHGRQDLALFDFGYCITCHKSQGSEFDSVLVLEEISSKWSWARWRYTATTRAKEQLTYCF